MPSHNPQCTGRAQAMNRRNRRFAQLRRHDESTVGLQRKALPELFRYGYFELRFKLFLLNGKVDAVVVYVVRRQEGNFFNGLAFVTKSIHKSGSYRRQ